MPLPEQPSGPEEGRTLASPRSAPTQSDSGGTFGFGTGEPPDSEAEAIHPDRMAPLASPVLQISVHAATGSGVTRSPRPTTRRSPSGAQVAIIITFCSGSHVGVGSVVVSPPPGLGAGEPRPRASTKP